MWGTGNAILSNAIFANGGLGIDLGADGVTPNDAGDLDAGPNNLQNFPVVTAATIAAGGDTVLQWTLDSTPDTTFLIQVFVNDQVDPHGLRRRPDAPGRDDRDDRLRRQRSFSVTAEGTILGRFFTATATSLIAGVPLDTSEFGPTLEGPSLVVTSTGDAIANDFVTTLRRGDHLRQHPPGRRHDHLRHPVRSVDDQPGLGAARHHGPGDDRRDEPAGLLRHADRRAERARPVVGASPA